MDRDRSIVRDYCAGLSSAGNLDEIGRRHGVSRSTVKRVAARNGLPRRDITRWTPHAIALIRRHYNRDKTAAQLAAIIGTTRNAVIGAAHRHIVPEN